MVSENKKNRGFLLCNRHGWGTWIRTKEMSDSESDALPLGYTPMCLYNTLKTTSWQVFFI